MDILIDYLTFTSKSHTPQEIVDLLGLSELKFEEKNGNYNGWYSRKYCTGISIKFGERDDIGIELSGVGCRMVETANNNKWKWEPFLAYLINDPDTYNISRLDIAGDDHEGLLSMNSMYRHVQQLKYVSKARKKVWLNGDEQEIIFGSSASDTRLRIYNKALERGVNEHWIRAEFQFRDKAADSSIYNLIQQKEIGKTYGGVLLNYLRFTTEKCDEYNHQDRLKTTRWWSKFVGTSQKIKNITIGGLEYNYSNLHDYVTIQTASSLKTFLLAHQGDLSFLLDIIQHAELNSKQKELLKRLEACNYRGM